MAQGIFYSIPALSLIWLESSTIFWSLSCAGTNICWREIKKRPAVWRKNNNNFIMCVFSSTNILFIQRTTLFYWKFWCSAGLSLYKESSLYGMMPIGVSYALSPTCRRYTVFPVFQPLLFELLTMLGLPEVSACCITASKAGWATAWWRMLLCVLAFMCAFHPLSWSSLTINLAWDTLWKSTGASELVHAAAQCWEGSGWQTRSTSPLRWPALPCQSRIVGKSSWKSAVLPERTKEFLVGNVTSLFIYSTYLPHSSHKLDFP